MTSYQDQINALAERVAALEANAAIPGPAPRKPKPEDETLFADLRSWRRERAEADGHGDQPFRIFGDAILTAIATAKPVDRYELQQIKGIGPEKLSKYGGEVLAIVAKYIEERVKWMAEHDPGDW